MENCPVFIWFLSGYIEPYSWDSATKDKKIQNVYISGTLQAAVKAFVSSFAE